MADQIGHLERSEHGNERAQRRLDDRVELLRIGGADVDEVEHFAQHREPHAVPEKAWDLLANADRAKADVVAEAHRGGHRLLARALAGDHLDEDDQLRLHRMQDDRPFRVCHVGGQPRHREVRGRAPQQRIGVDDRLDVAVARRLGLGVLDDRLHHRDARRERRGEIVMGGDAAQDLVDGGRLQSADLGQRRDTLAQPLVQRMDRCGR